MNIKHWCVLFLVSVVLFPYQGFSQASTYFADRYYDADDMVYTNNYAEALPIYMDLYQMGKDNCNIAFNVGVCYLKTQQEEKAISFFLQASKNVSLKYTGKHTEKSAPVFLYFYLGQAYHALDSIDKAIANYKTFKSYLTQKNKDLIKEVNYHLGLSYNALKFKKNPLIIRIENLGEGINSKFDEYAPAISSDENTLVFTSRRKGSTGNLLDNQMKYFEDIYIAQKNNEGIWEPPTSISKNINTIGHEASLTLSPDKKTLFIYKDDRGDGNIYTSKQNGNTWTIPQKLSEEINSSKGEFHACLSPDGKQLFFSSDRNGGQGGKDLYVSKWENGEWGKAQNLGDKINSEYDEDAPFISADGKTLYFCSKGHENIGGYDIFTSKLSADGFWSTPRNRGYPINTVKDDIFYNPTTDELRGYYSSKQVGGMGELDILMLTIKKEAEPFALLRGTIKDPMSFKPIHAEIEIIDKGNNQVVALLKSSESNGDYKVSLPDNKTYAVKIAADNFESKTDNVFVSPDLKGQEFTRNYELNPLDSITGAPKIASKPIPPAVSETKNYALKETITTPKPVSYQTNETFVMNNIYYNYGKAILLPESFEELDRLLVLLKKNPELIIEVSGHTDNVSSAGFNKKLSEKRAEVVVNYLVSKGISEHRLKAVGYGFDNPLATNTTADGRSQNRRTEFKIIAKDKTQIVENPLAKSYKIQFKTSIKLLPLNSPELKGIEQVKYYKHENIYKYTVGEADTKEELFSPLEEVKKKGFPDAFIAEFSGLDRNYGLGDIAEKNITYKIQVLSSNQKKPLNAPELAKLTDISIVEQNGIYKYLVGTTYTRQDATKILEAVIKLGYSEAFIVKLENNKLPEMPMSIGVTNTAPLKGKKLKEAESGINFRVQFTSIAEKKDINSPDFKELKEVRIYEIGNKYRYTSGIFLSLLDATAWLETVKQKGFPGAYVVAFDGERQIDVHEALNKLK